MNGARFNARQRHRNLADDVESYGLACHDIRPFFSVHAMRFSDRLRAPPATAQLHPHVRPHRLLLKLGNPFSPEVRQLNNVRQIVPVARREFADVSPRMFSYEADVEEMAQF
jgi:hypothetical protein